MAMNTFLILIHIFWICRFYGDIGNGIDTVFIASPVYEKVMLDAYLLQQMCDVWLSGVGKKPYVSSLTVAFLCIVFPLFYLSLISHGKCDRQLKSK